MLSLPQPEPGKKYVIEGSVLKLLIDIAQRADNLSVQSPLTLHRSMAGRVIGISPSAPQMLVALLGAQDGTDPTKYAWTESRRSEGIGFWNNSFAGQRSGTTSSNPAINLDYNYQGILSGMHAILMRTMMYDGSSKLFQGWIIVNINPPEPTGVSLLNTSGPGGAAFAATDSWSRDTAGYPLAFQYVSRLYKDPSTSIIYYFTRDCIAGQMGEIHSIGAETKQTP